jgi:transposase
MLTIGVDSHQCSYMAAAIDHAGRPMTTLAVPATDAGRQRLRAWAGGLAALEPRQWGIEGSGSYGRSLAQLLVASGEAVFEVPGLATAQERGRSLGRQRDKTDATDALAIARVTLREAERLPRITPAGGAYRCKLLSEHRDNLVLQRTRALNQLYAHLAALEQREPGTFRAARGRRTLAALARRVPASTDPIQDLQARIAQQLAELVQQYDQLIAQTTLELRSLATLYAPTLLELRGVGALTAAKILGEAGDIRRFQYSAKFAAYAGVAPIEASSGDRRRHRLSRRGNRQLNCAIHTIAVTQRRWHP